MFQADEVVRVLTGAIMEILPDGGVVHVSKSSVSGDPLDERFCVQIDARSEEVYVVRVVEMTGAQRRQITGRTEEALRAKVEGGWSIKVWHYRATEFGVTLTKWQAKKYGYVMKAKGGRTEVEITSPDGVVTFSGTATCSPDDAYCRAEGRVVALDRAVTAYVAAGYPTMTQLVEGGYPDGGGAS